MAHNTRPATATEMALWEAARSKFRNALQLLLTNPSLSPEERKEEELRLRDEYDRYCAENNLVFRFYRGSFTVHVKLQEAA